MDNRKVARQILGLAKEIVASKTKYVDFPKKFWVVTDPKKQQGYEDAELEDILFEADMEGMELQFRGGLKIEQVYGIYGDEKKAIKDAEALTGKG